MAKLTTPIIKAAPATGKLYYLWDDRIRGFGVRVSPAGAKAYVLSYRADGRKRFFTIGRTDQVSLSNARNRAADEISKLRLGAGGPAERRTERQQAPTVEKGLAQFFDEYVPDRIVTGSMTETTARKYRNQADAHLLPCLGKLKVADVSRQDVQDMAQRMSDTPVLRNRVLAFTSRLFNWFEQMEYRPQNTNPAKFVARAREEARDRTLSEVEIGALSKSLHIQHNKNSMAASVIRVLMLTGLRVSEVLNMEWQHIDFETGRLLIPESKTGKRHHHLPSPALALLEGLPRPRGLTRIFACHRGPIQYKTVRLNFIEAAKRAGIIEVGLHDLRRTVMTQAARDPNVNTHILRDLLGHKTTAMADRYIRAVGNPVRAAREQVGAAMAQLMDVEHETAQVLPFKQKI